MINFIRKVAFVVIFLLCILGNRAHAVTINGITYALDYIENNYSHDNEAKVIACSETVTKAVIPREITVMGRRYPVVVTKIGDGAFSGCKNLTSVELPLFLEEIGSSAFEDCSNLYSINIPMHVKEMAI